MRSLATTGDGTCWPCCSGYVGLPVSRCSGSAFLPQSATPDDLLSWLVSGNAGSAEVIRPAAAASSEADVQLDYVGSLANAATVISRLHRGEKRLVFVDSRARAEELSTALRQLEVKTFVTHSSLSREQRRMAEEAFASQTDCVIVATSVLELGVGRRELGPGNPDRFADNCGFLPATPGKDWTARGRPPQLPDLGDP